MRFCTHVCVVLGLDNGGFTYNLIWENQRGLVGRQQGEKWEWMASMGQLTGRAGF